MSEMYFFWSGNGRPETAVRGWRRSLEHVYTAADLKRNGKKLRVHTHLLRHTFAMSPRSRIGTTGSWSFPNIDLREPWQHRCEAFPNPDCHTFGCRILKSLNVVEVRVIQYL